MAASAEIPHAPEKWAHLKRWAPLGLLVLAIGAAYALGLHRYVSLGAIALNRDALKSFVADNLLLALGAYALVYVAAVALSLPGAAFLTVAGGFLFGWSLSVPVTVLAATAGAILVFLAVRTSLGAFLAERAGPFAQKLSQGFARNAFSYLLFLRLVPAFPFFAVNAVAGLARVSLKTFVLATLLGIIPGSFVFSYLGQSFDGLIEAQMQAYRACMAAGTEGCRVEIDPMALVTPEIVIGLCLLGALALIPAVIQWIRPGKAEA